MSKIIKDEADGNVAEIDVDFITQTPDALLISDGSKEVWIPKSQIIDSEKEDGKIIKIYIPEWLAQEKELI